MGIDMLLLLVYNLTVLAATASDNTMKVSSATISKESLIDEIKNASPMQCAHRCRRHTDCKESAISDVNGSMRCLLVSKRTIAKRDNNSITMLNVKKVTPIKRPPDTKLPESCKEVFDSGIEVDGFQNLASGRHYCNMTLAENCGDGGWTLALSSDGTKPTFKYDSPYWENEKPLGAGQLPFDTESKFPAFWKIKMTALCLVMRWPRGQTKALKFNDNSLKSPAKSLSGKTLLDVMKAGYMETKFNRNTFTSALGPDGFEFDRKCNHGGFGIKSREEASGKMRIGMLFDHNPGFCKTSRSFLAIGYYRQPEFNWHDQPEIYAGAACSTHESCQPQKVVAAWAYLYVQ